MKAVGEGGIPREAEGDGKSDGVEDNACDEGCVRIDDEGFADWAARASFLIRRARSRPDVGGTGDVGGREAVCWGRSSCFGIGEGSIFALTKGRDFGIAWSSYC